jgi:uncharacterized protein (DUF1800 family)
LADHERAAGSLQAFRPGEDGPWDRAAAAHLARRAGFGMEPAAVDRILELGPGRAPLDLFEPRAEPEGVDLTASTALRLANVEAAQSAWAYRMLFGATPAIEKLALFWHGHFATSARKVDDAKLMLGQIDLFRRKGAGPFLDLLGGVARDPAMLVWLDGNSNRRGKPNENFARELFELFALGIGNYTEADIKEAARAFTGWHVRDGEYWFNQRAHDTGAKTVFGRSGEWGGDDILKMSAGHEACARFISGKLFEFYVYPAPGQDLRGELAALFRECGGRTGEFLGKLLGSRVFHSRKARRALVSSPADYTVGSLRTIGAKASAKALARSMASMGLELLAPPSVKGWAGGEAWLSSTTLLSRYGFAMGVGGESDFGGDPLDVVADWDRVGAAGPAALFFPEGLPDAIGDDVRGVSGGDARTLVMSCLQAPEAQYI